MATKHLRDVLTAKFGVQLMCSVSGSKHWRVCSWLTTLHLVPLGAWLVQPKHWLSSTVARQCTSAIHGIHNATKLSLTTSLKMTDSFNLTLLTGTCCAAAGLFGYCWVLGSLLSSLVDWFLPTLGEGWLYWLLSCTSYSSYRALYYTLHLANHLYLTSPAGLHTSKGSFAFSDSHKSSIIQCQLLVPVGNTSPASWLPLLRSFASCFFKGLVESLWAMWGTRFKAVSTHACFSQQLQLVHALDAALTACSLDCLSP